MTFQWILPAFLSLGLAATAQAADTQFCNHYAQTSIKQQIANVAGSCGHTGIRWSPLYVGQNRWCQTVRKQVAQNETTARKKALDTCGVDLQTLGSSTFESGYSIADALFEEMKAATLKDDVIAVKVMHAHGVSIHHQYGGNYAAMLYQAVDHQAEQTASYLLSQGADPKIIINGGGNALSKMLEDDNINYRMLAMLLNNGFDPNYGGEGYSDRYFPLLMSAQKNDYRSVQMLLEAGASPNLSRDSNALIYAIKNQNVSIATLLVNAGADVNQAGNIFSCTPLDLAKKSGNATLIQFLIENGATPSNYCHLFKSKD